MDVVLVGLDYMFVGWWSVQRDPEYVESTDYWIR